MTADELRSLADTLEQCSPFRDSASVYQAATYLRACADALDAGPVAWAVRDMSPGIEHWVYVADYRDAAYQHIKDAAQTSELAVMSRTWQVVQTYPLAMPSQAQPMRLPEPLTDEEVDALIDETEGMETDRAVRYLVETGERRVKEVNE